MSDGTWALINVGVGALALMVIYIAYILVNRKYQK